MPTYVIQDSDWDWNNADGGGFLITADNPRRAALQAAKRLSDGDSVHFKIAELKLIGFISWDIEHGLDRFQPLSEAALNEAINDEADEADEAVVDGSLDAGPGHDSFDGKFGR